jgi:hypothetical protein
MPTLIINDLRNKNQPPMICNHQVVGSIPTGGSILKPFAFNGLGFYFAHTSLGKTFDWFVFGAL